MEPYFALLVIAIITIIFMAILGFVSVHITTRKYVPDAAGASKALALSLISYVGSGMLLSLAMKLTDDKPDPFGYVVPTQIWIKIAGTIIAWVLALFGTWQLTKKIYATTGRLTMAIAWQLLAIISLTFGINLWRLILWMLQTSEYR